MKKKTKVFLGIVVVAAAGVGFMAWRNASRPPVNPNLNAPTIELAKGDMVKTVSASGAVESASTANVYSTQATYPVMEILVETGDTVKKGDVLARLDMSKLEDDIEQAELNLRTAQVNAGEEERVNANSITTAETSLSNSQISLERQAAATANAEEDLQKAEADAEEPFDSYSFDKGIEDARVNVERREEDLQKAQEDLDEALNEFDDYAFQNAINEASIQAERRREDLDKAEADLQKELDDNEVDTYNNDNLINDASRNYSRLHEARLDAEKALEDLTLQYNGLLVIGNTFTTEAANAAKAKVDAAEATLKQAKQAEEDAQRALDKAKTDKNRAEDNAEDAKDTTVEGLQKAVDNASNLLADAQRAQEKAETDLQRAKDDAATAAQDAYDRAQDAVFDARRAHEKALSDKERAIEDYIEANADKLEAAQKSYDDSQKQLETARNSLTTAENSLEQANEKPLTGATNIELQQINLDRLYTTLKEGDIIASEDGVITELNAKVGAPPSGILFVIEDAQDLYVSANIKEYSLSSVAMGQKAFVTTDATGEQVFDAEVNYISPKAVSPAGSTSVEFEIRAGFDGGDAVKIGMNAFLNVVTQTAESVYSVPLSAIVTDERGSFVYSPNGAERIEIPVTVGIKTTTQGEISGGELHDGLVVLTQPTELPRSQFPMMFN